MKMKMLLAAGAAVAALVSGATTAQAKDVLAIVVKGLDNPFFEQINLGCQKWMGENADSEYECLYTGPASSADEAGEVQIVEDLLNRPDVKAIAISPSNAPAMGNLIRRVAPSIPVMTIDADLIEADRDLRATYLGTDNYEMGVLMAKHAMELKPDGGTVCLQLGNVAADNINARAAGFRDTIAGEKVDRLTGQNGWTEVDGCPVFTNDQIDLANQQMQDVFTANPDLDAFILIGGWAQFGPQAYAQVTDQVKDKLDSKELVIIAGDTLPPQMDALRAGRSHAQVGQLDRAVGVGVAEPPADVVHGLLKRERERGQLLPAGSQQGGVTRVGHLGAQHRALLPDPAGGHPPVRTEQAVRRVLGHGVVPQVVDLGQPGPPVDARLAHRVGPAGLAVEHLGGRPEQVSHVPVHAAQLAARGAVRSGREQHGLHRHGDDDADHRLAESDQREVEGGEVGALGDQHHHRRHQRRLLTDRREPEPPEQHQRRGDHQGDRPRLVLGDVGHAQTERGPDERPHERVAPGAERRLQRALDGDDRGDGREPRVGQVQQLRAQRGQPGGDPDADPALDHAPVGGGDLRRSDGHRPWIIPAHRPRRVDQGVRPFQATRRSISGASSATSTASANGMSRGTSAGMPA